MAVISVVGDWRSLGLTQRGGILSVPVKFIVTFDDADNSMLRPLLARIAVDPNYPTDPWRKVPDDNSGHPYNPWLYCQNKTVNALGPMDYEVECIFSNGGVPSGSDSQREMFANPCDQPWGIEWDAIEEPQKIDMAYDDNGNLTKRLGNANDEPFDPPLQELATFTVLRIARNLPTWDDKLMSQYGNVTNTDTFWGYSPGTALCRAPKAKRMQYANIFYFAAAYEFVFTPQDPLWTWGWKKHLLHEGFKEKKLNQDTGKYEAVPAMDKDPLTGEWHLVALPVPLHLDGTRLPPHRDGIPDEPIVAIDFITKRKKPFSVLGVNR
jgi:hypothetical protein